jgi:hypothetical protein
MPEVPSMISVFGDLDVDNKTKKSIVVIMDISSFIQSLRSLIIKQSLGFSQLEISLLNIQ